MKRLVIAIVLLALAAVGALVVSGLLYSGSKYQAEVVIQAPAAEVYRWLTEPEKLKQWVGGLVDSRPLDDRLKPGARSVETIEDGGVSFQMETEALEVVPEKLLTFRLSAEGDFGFEGVSRYTLSETAGATRLALTQEIRYKSFFLKAISPLLAGQVEQKLDADFGTLKRLAEGAADPVKQG